MSSIHLITMPQWGLEMTEGSISTWHIAVGDTITKGKELVDIETSKIVNTMEALADMPGVVRRLVAKIGDTIQVGGLLGVTAEPQVGEEEIDRFLVAQGVAVAAAPAPVAVAAPTIAEAGAAPAAPPVPAPAVVAPTIAAPVPALSATVEPSAPSAQELARIAQANAAVHASPVARRAANRAGIELSRLTGTGRLGRIALADLGLAPTEPSRPQRPCPGDERLVQRNAIAQASPVARRLANRLGIDLSTLSGTGRHGRVSVADIEALRPDALLPLAAAPEMATAEVSATLAAPVRAGPAARKLAAELGVDLATVKGTGPRNLVLKTDVHGAFASAQAPAAESAAPAVSAAGEAESTLVELTPMRKAIAASLTRSKQTIPHFYLTADLQLDALTALRQAINAERDARKLSINDFLLRATARALAEVPEANVHFTDGGIRRFHGVHLCLAVAIEGGLVTPVIRDAQAKSVFAIAEEAAELAERARRRTLTHAQLSGGTFTVSNLGMYGIRQFDAVINPPQGAILAVGAARREASEAQDGALRWRSVASVTLSCDHRAIDGAVGASFLAALRRQVERPHGLLG